MSSQFTARLLVFTDGSGQEWVTSVLPTGVALREDTLRQFVMRGAVPPEGWPGPFRVENADNWIWDMRKLYAIEAVGLRGA